MIDDGVEVGLEAAHTLGIWGLPAEHVEEIGGVAKIAPWSDWLGALTEPPEGRDDRRYAGHDCGWAIGDERDRSGGDSQRVHRFERALGTVAEQANGSCRQLTLGRQLVPERGQLGFGGQPAMPEQPGCLLECRSLGQLVNPIAGNDQFAALAVDVAQRRRCRNHALEAAVHHDRNVAPVYDCVNID